MEKRNEQRFLSVSNGIYLYLYVLHLDILRNSYINSVYANTVLYGYNTGSRCQSSPARTFQHGGIPLLDLAHHVARYLIREIV